MFCLKLRPTLRKIDKPGIFGQFLEIRVGQDRRVFVAANKKIDHATASAATLVGPVAKLFVIALDKLKNGAVPVWAGDANKTAGFQTTVHFREMKLKQIVGKMLDHAVGIKNIDRLIGKRQLVSQIGSNVDFCSEAIGVHIDPAFDVFFLHRSKVHFYDTLAWGAKSTIQSAIAFHGQSH